MRLAFIAHQTPAQAIARFGRQWALRHPRLQSNTGQRRFNVTICRKFMQTFRQTAGYAHQACGRMIEINPLKTKR